MERALNVLVIDDSDDDRELYRRVLKLAFGDRLNLLEETNGESGLDAIEKAEPHCVLLDYSLPGRNGIEVLKRIRNKHLHLPIILLTGQGNEAIAAQSIKEGAQDYITKGEITAEALSRAIRTAIENGAQQKRITEQHLALEIFTQALAHDLKEPVHTICSFAKLACDREIESDKRDKYMRHIRGAGERMTVLIDTLLSYTQLDGLGEPRHEIFSLNEAVTAAEANLLALFGERDTMMSVGPLPEVTACRVQIVQVLQNLMSNAVSHSLGPVHIRIGVERDGEAMRIFVRDDGPGIASEYQRQIFEPFRRLNRANAHCGLGLAICKKIVEAHGGKIGCESKIGQGSNFFFNLCEAAATVNTSAGEERIAEMRDLPENMTMANVLLVDDLDQHIMLARAVLTGPLGMRCNFLVAHDGKEGLTTIRDQSGKNDPVDLILLDINMPVMNGFEMLDAIGHDVELCRTPVVMCSGSAWEKDKERARMLGAVGFLTKPVFFKDLQPIIARSSSLRLCQNDTGQFILMRVGLTTEGNGAHGSVRWKEQGSSGCRSALRAQLQ
jgi:signal transduction histidine kinase